MSRPSCMILCVAAIALAARPAASEEAAESGLGVGFHAGAGLTVRQPAASDAPLVTPDLELGLIAVETVDVYLAVGLDVRRESFEDGDRKETSAAGALSTEVGARLILGELRPGSAFFHVGVAAVPVFGIASYESDTGDDEADEEADYREERASEFMDRFEVGLRLGVEYLVSEDFGLGAQTGFMVSVNDLKDTDREEPDEHLELGFYIPFSVRVAYHF